MWGKRKSGNQQTRHQAFYQLESRHESIRRNRLDLVIGPRWSTRIGVRTVRKRDASGGGTAAKRALAG
jgi:hypothetical protein